MNRGVPPTARKARTGELTPSGTTVCARSNRALLASEGLWGTAGSVATVRSCQLAPLVTERDEVHHRGEHQKFLCGDRPDAAIVSRSDDEGGAWGVQRR